MVKKRRRSRKCEGKWDKLDCIKCMIFLGMGSKRISKALGFQKQTGAISRAIAKARICFGIKAKRPLIWKEFNSRSLVLKKQYSDKMVHAFQRNAFLKDLVAQRKLFRWIESTAYKPFRHKRHLEKQKEKQRSDIQLIMRSRLRRRIRKMCENKRAHKSCWEIIGCDWEKFKDHIESQFAPGMKWENRGQWHIDHIVPCAAFDLSIQSQWSICFHYTNLRPLWADDNHSKGARFTVKDVLSIKKGVKKHHNQLEFNDL